MRPLDCVPSRARAGSTACTGSTASAVLARLRAPARLRRHHCANSTVRARALCVLGFGPWTLMDSEPKALKLPGSSGESPRTLRQGLGLGRAGLLCRSVHSRVVSRLVVSQIAMSCCWFASSGHISCRIASGRAASCAVLGLLRRSARLRRLDCARWSSMCGVYTPEAHGCGHRLAGKTHVSGNRPMASPRFSFSCGLKAPFKAKQYDSAYAVLPRKGP